MTYKLEYEQKARKQLKKLDVNTRNNILNWLDKNIANTSNPRQHGKALTGTFAGLWRYRVGNYRIICSIQDDQLIVLALQIDHRSSIYKLKR